MLSKDKTPLHPDPVYFTAQKDGMNAEVAMQWCSDSFTDSVFGYVNSIKTVDGGTHLDGFKFALTKVINTQGKANNRLKASIGNLSGDFVREGLCAILSVQVPNPE